MRTRSDSTPGPSSGSDTIARKAARASAMCSEGSITPASLAVSMLILMLLSPALKAGAALAGGGRTTHKDGYCACCARLPRDRQYALRPGVSN